MSKNKFDDFYSKKSISELIEKLREGRINPATIDKEWEDALIKHLNSRGLSIIERNMVKRILTSDIETLKSDSEKIEKDKLNATPTSNDSESSRYTALKTIVGLISALGYIVIILGVIVLIYLGSQGQLFMGFIGLVTGVIISLPLLAFSNLIYVFIDIEQNTRKTREAINKN